MSDSRNTTLSWPAKAGHPGHEGLIGRGNPRPLGGPDKPGHDNNFCADQFSRMEFLRGIAGVALASTAFASPARAQTVGAFYAGRTVRLVIPTAPGGINDLSGRLVARHLR